jgi:hypothetical protein
METAIEIHSPHLAEALLSDEERAQKSALLVIVLGPSLRRTWRQNTKMMYSTPGGMAFDESSGWLVYVDTRQSTLRALRASKRPGGNIVLIDRHSELKEPTGVSLARFIVPSSKSLSKGPLFLTFAIITDPGAGAIFCVNLTKLVSPQSGNGEEEEEKIGNKNEGESEKKRVYKLQKVALLGEGKSVAGNLVGPCGIALDQLGSTHQHSRSIEMFVLCRAPKQLVMMTLSAQRKTKGVTLTAHATKRLASLAECDGMPYGVAVESPERVLVTCGSNLLRVHRNSGEVSIFVEDLAPDLRGVAVCALQDPSSLPIVVASEKGGLFCVTSSSGEKPTTRRVAGSMEAPTCLLEEGTALECTLGGPGDLCFAGNSVLFADRGHRSICLLTDAYHQATQLMPALYGLAIAMCEDVNMGEAERLVQIASDLVEKMVVQNAERTGRNLNAEGPQGNFSRVVRKSLTNLLLALRRRVLAWKKLDVPSEVQNAAVFKAMTTLCVERFFPLMRARWTHPYVMQYFQERANVIVEETKRLTNPGFSYFTGKRKRDEHYIDCGATPCSVDAFVLGKTRVTTRHLRGEEKQDAIETRARELEDLYAAAVCYRGVTTQRVTDTGKEMIGAKPSVAYPAGTFTSAGIDNSSDVEATSRPAVQVSVVWKSTTVYRKFTLVYVKAVASAAEDVFFGQLMESIVLMEPVGRRGRAKLAPPKPHIQYFKGGETLNSEYLRYTRDKNSFPTVAVAAIHGLVEQYVAVSHDSAGMLTSFDIQTEELERIEGVVNEEESDEEEEEEQKRDETIRRLTRQQEAEARSRSISMGPIAEGVTRARRRPQSYYDLMEDARAHQMLGLEHYARKK